jgi:hypothetical protein
MEAEETKSGPATAPAVAAAAASKFDEDALACYGIDLAKTSNYELNRHFTIATSNNQDHTFNGIMFDIEHQPGNLPLDFLVIHTLSVRGMLGPVTVWTCKDTFRGKQECPREWTNIYRAIHEPSMRTFQELGLKQTIMLKPRESIGVYVHSGLQNDKGIVYDNKRGSQGSDEVLGISTAIAHTSSEPFSPHGYWGGGWAWRDRRQFVGKISYGVKFLLWQPSDSINSRFPPAFQTGVEVMLQNVKDFRLSRLPEHVVWYIINMLPYDWIITGDGDEHAYGSGRAAAYVFAQQIRQRISCRSRSCVIV